MSRYLTGDRKTSVRGGLRILALALALSLGSGFARASDSFRTWLDASSGESSFVHLGDAFMVQTPMEQVPGARTVLVNQELLKRFGLTAGDQASLEKLVAERFGIMVSQNPNSSRKAFATRYLDYDEHDLKELGNPQGDGRAVWAGEIVLQTQSGRTIYLDVSLKGVGRTPLAREIQENDNSGKGNNHQYSDGLQTMDEAVRSFIASQTLVRNHIPAVVDVAVIELPVGKVNPETGQREKAAISVRIGPQTRIGHLKYHAKSPDNFAKIFEYVVRRDLGLKLDTPVTPELVDRFLENFALHIGRQAGNYAALDLVHGSLSVGNQTTAGYPIDFGTFMALDAHHAMLPYLNDNFLVRNQAIDIGAYINILMDLLKKSNYPVKYTRKKTDELQALYERTVRETLTNARLARLGLSQEFIDRMPVARKSEFYRITQEMALTSADHGKKVHVYGLYNIHPAAFELRTIFRDSVEIFSRPLWMQPNWQSRFIPKRYWNQMTVGDFKASSHDNKYGGLLNQYTQWVQQTIEDLNKSANPADGVQQTISRARKIAEQERAERFFPDTSRLVAQIRNPNSSCAANSGLAADMVQKLVDPLPNPAKLQCRALFR